ncbi:MAG: AmmeMemoRadiSam system protein B [Alphaproteobacteria bacterium]|nr:AmmeMemoRadiSam system protein B [Alphaproteobacteria bacterium]
MTVRPAAVAGTFYPAEGARLGAQVDDFLARAVARLPADAPTPKALIVPHAGYVYSGPIAATAYARLAALRGQIERVVLLGPAHRVALTGLAVPSVAAFETPLGRLALDRPAIEALLALPEVQVSDEAHAQEHSLEVHLPFLQRTLGSVRLVPIVVGAAAPETVARVLEQLWGGPETLIVVSTDLSHFHDYDAAQTRDARTCGAIESLAYRQIGPEDACGARPVNGLLRLAQLKDLRATTLDVRNSGDTAGPRDRVVGYGAWCLTEGTASRTSKAGRETLLTVAARSIRNGVNNGRQSEVRIGTFGPEIEARRGSFTTLKLDGRLRGCIGTLEVRLPLVADVAKNAYASAFADPRFSKLTKAEFPALEISISILGAAGEMRFRDEEDLIGQLRPGIDGLILRRGRNRGVFLPQVWEQAADAPDFLRMLKRKAGLAADFWADDVAVSRFTTETFAAPVGGLPI